MGAPTCSAAALGDAETIDLWLTGRPESTRRAYAADVRQFLGRAGKPIVELSPTDVIRAASGPRGTAAVKSLISFAAKVGAIEEDVGKVVRTPRVPRRLHERILTEDEVEQVVREAAPGRNRALVRLLYYGGLRVAEAVKLQWIDVGANVVHVVGKGNRSRSVWVPSSVVRELRTLRGKADNERTAVFKGRAGGHITVRQARRVVCYAGLEALGRSISPHVLRHSHATNALERGAPIHVVQHTLGHASVATCGAYLHVRPGSGSAEYLVRTAARRHRTAWRGAVRACTTPDG